MGPGRRCRRLSHHQGGDLDVFPRLAIHRLGSADRHHRCLLPAGHRRLAYGKISRVVRLRGRRQRGTVRSPKRRSLAASEGSGMSDPIIEIENVSKSFGGVVANRGVTLTVPKGSITGLIGPNGSGKTTLFSSIVGYHPIDSGSIRFDGQEISRMRVQEIARLGLLRTFQTTRIYGKMSGMQNMLISIPHRKAGFFEMF